jgi:hypothetical protein
VIGQIKRNQACTDQCVSGGSRTDRELVREMQNEGKVRSVGVRGLVEPGGLEVCLFFLPRWLGLEGREGRGREGIYYADLRM